MTIADNGPRDYQEWGRRDTPFHSHLAHLSTLRKDSSHDQQDPD